MSIHREEGPHRRGLSRYGTNFRKKTSALMVEALEPRCLLAADLSGAFLSTPAAALSGTKQAVIFNVVNNGDVRAKGSMGVAFYAALDGDTFDPNTAQFLGKLTKSISIAPGGTLNVNYTLPVIAALPADSYRIYAVLDSDHKIAESDEGNNTLQSAPIAIAQPDYDLLAAFDPKTVLLPAVVQGINTNATARVTITNNGGSTAKLPSGQAVVIQVVARPVGASDELSDVVLNRTVTNASLSALAPGKSKTFSIAIHFPSTLAVDEYLIVVKVDTGHALAETDEGNNEATFTQHVNVAAPFNDPTVVFNSGTVIPLAVVADGRKLPMKFDFTNLGNVKIPAGQTCSLAIIAHNINTSATTALQTLVVSLTNLGAGAKKTLSLSPTIPLNLTTGEFDIEAILTTTLSGDIVGNNSASSATSFNVGPAFFNLSVLSPTTTFNPSVVQGVKTSGTVTVGIKNLSNAIITPGTIANVSVALHPVGASNSANDIPIGTANNVAIGNLAIGATKAVKVSCNIPATILPFVITPADDYEIVVTMSAPLLPESTQIDNTVTGGVIKVAPSTFVDLAIVQAGQNYRTPSANGTNGIGTVVLRNTGNVTIQANITIQFLMLPTNSAVSTGIGERTFFVSLAPGASTVPQSVALHLDLPNNGLLATEAEITARIATSFVDGNLADNQRSAGSIVISSQVVDLKITSATNPFSGTLDGNSTGSAHVKIGNIGSGISAGPVTISYYATESGNLDGNEFLLGSEVANISLGGAQLSPIVDVDLTLPNPLSETTYKIVAKISSALTLDNNTGNNLTTVLGTVTVEPIII